MFVCMGVLRVLAGSDLSLSASVSGRDILIMA
jgi:hypothetical protein